MARRVALLLALACVLALLGGAQASAAAAERAKAHALLLGAKVRAFR